VLPGKGKGGRMEGLREEKMGREEGNGRGGKR